MGDQRINMSTLGVAALRLGWRAGHIANGLAVALVRVGDPVGVATDGLRLLGCSRWNKAEEGHAERRSETQYKQAEVHHFECNILIEPAIPDFSSKNFDAIPTNAIQCKNCGRTEKQDRTGKFFPRFDLSHSRNHISLVIFGQVTLET